MKRNNKKRTKSWKKKWVNWWTFFFQKRVFGAFGQAKLCDTVLTLLYYYSILYCTANSAHRNYFSSVLARASADHRHGQDIPRLSLHRIIHPLEIISAKNKKHQATTSRYSSMTNGNNKCERNNKKRNWVVSTDRSLQNKGKKRSKEEKSIAQMAGGTSPLATRDSLFGVANYCSWKQANG